ACAGQACNDSSRRLLRVVVAHLDDPQRTTAQRYHVARPPVRNGGAERRRVGVCAVLALEPVGEGHSILPSVNRLGPNGKTRLPRRAAAGFRGCQSGDSPLGGGG